MAQELLVPDQTLRDSFTQQTEKIFNESYQHLYEREVAPEKPFEPTSRQLCFQLPIMQDMLMRPLSMELRITLDII